MEKYISVTDLSDKIKKLNNDDWYLEGLVGTDELYELVSTLPAADVVEIKHGTWMPHIITSGRSYYFCSICKEMVDIPASFMIHRFHYCPYCGAKMMEE